MLPKFPLTDVILKKVEHPRKVVAPLVENGTWQISQNEFAMQIEGVCAFYACNGNEVEFAPAENATKASVELYLNGSVFGAILHQRKIMPIHGSSFILNKQGVMLCGESGAGKSSLTAAFCMEGAQFLTDDVTPIVFENHIPLILPLSDRIKLWNHSLQQLKQEKNNLTAITPGEEKYYFPMEKGLNNAFPLAQVFILELSENSTPEILELDGIEAFAALRNEIYRWEYLPAMKENEKEYFRNLVDIGNTVRIFRIWRPIEISVHRLKESIYQSILLNSKP